MTKSLMFERPRENEFTQGTVFSCAHAEDYLEASVYGLVVTARCDAAQDKTPIFSYIPVVSLHDWILGDGANIVMDRLSSECQSTLRSALKDASLSDSLMGTKSVDEIYESHFKVRENDKEWRKRCPKIQASIDMYKKTQLLRVVNNNKDERKAQLKTNTATVDAVVKELSGNRLTGFYLLRDMPSLNGDESNYVALLREIHHIPTVLIRKMVQGISKQAWPMDENGKLHCPKFVGADDLAAPVAKLKSPWIEHVMQNFTMLFARIGVADNDFIAVKKSLSSIGLD